MNQFHLSKRGMDAEINFYPTDENSLKRNAIWPCLVPIGPEEENDYDKDTNNKDSDEDTRCEDSDKDTSSDKHTSCEESDKDTSDEDISWEDKEDYGRTLFSS